MRREDDGEVERATNSGVVLMTAAVSNLKRLSSSVVRFSATESENEDEIEAMRSVRGRGQGRDRALSFSSKTARIRFSEDLQRCILPVYPQASAKREAHDFGTVSSLIGSSAVNSFAPSEEPPPCAISEYFKNNFRKLQVRIAVLGAPAVGKTSIVERFVSNRFSTVHRATVARRLHYPVMVSANSLFELKVCDCPPIEHFTLNNTSASRRTAWTRYIGTALKDASVFVLVYDVTSEDSFNFVAHLREEMVAYFDAQKETQLASEPNANSNASRRVPIVVVGNKRDLQNANANGYGNGKENYCTPHERRSMKQKLSTCTFDSENYTFGNADLASEDGNELRMRTGTVRERTVHRRSPTNRSITSLQIQQQDSQKRYRSRSRLLKKLSSVSNPVRYGEGYNAIVTRNWKALHIECSAKFNWNISHIFQEIVKIVEEENGDLSRKSSRKGATIRQHCNKCTVS